MMKSVSANPSRIRTNTLPLQRGSSSSSIAIEPWPLRAVLGHLAVDGQRAEQRHAHQHERRDRREEPGGQEGDAGLVAEGREVVDAGEAHHLPPRVRVVGVVGVRRVHLVAQEPAGEASGSGDSIGVASAGFAGCAGSGTTGMPPPRGTADSTGKLPPPRRDPPLDNRQERPIFPVDSREETGCRPAVDLLQGTLDLLVLRTLQPGSPARLGHLAADPADLGGRPARQPGLALPVAPPARARGLDRGGVGQLRQQPAREVLPADARGPQAARRRDGELGAPVGRRRPRAAASPEPARAGPRPPLPARARLARDRVERELDDELRHHLELEAEQQPSRGAADPEAARAPRCALRRRRGRQGGVPRSPGACACWRRSRRTSSTARAACAGTRGFTGGGRADARRSASAPTPPSSASCAACCCGRCPTSAARRWWRSSSRAAVGRRGHRLLGEGDRRTTRRRSPSLEDVVEYHSMNFTLLGGAASRSACGPASSPRRFFDVLGVEPLLGRDVPQGRGRARRRAVLVLSHAYWQRHAGRRPEVVGRTFEMNDRVHTVVGVLPPLPQLSRRERRLHARLRLPVPVAARRRWTNRQARGCQAFARVRAGVPLERAQADVVTVVERLKKEYPDAYPKGIDPTAAARVRARGDGADARARRCWCCWATVGARAADRLRERREPRRSRASPSAAASWACARRSAPGAVAPAAPAADGEHAAGARRRRAWACWSRTSRATRSSSSPRASRRGRRRCRSTGRCSPSRSARRCSRASLVGSLPGLPAFERLARALLGTTGARPAAARKARLRTALAVSQLALSFMLLIGAALMLRSFAKLQSVDAGFRSRPRADHDGRPQLVEVRDARAPAPTASASCRRSSRSGSACARCRASSTAGTAWTFPLNSTFTRERRVHDRGRARATATRCPRAEYRGAIVRRTSRRWACRCCAAVSSTRHDVDGAEQVVVVSQSPRAPPLGRRGPVGARASRRDRGQTWARVVGVVGRRAPDRPRGGAAGPRVPAVRAVPRATPRRCSCARADDPAATRRPRARGSSARSTRRRAVSNVRTMDTIRHDALASPRLTAFLLGLFAFVALAISAAGLARRPRVLGQPAHARDRHPHGAGRGARAACCGCCWARASSRSRSASASALLGALALSRFVSGLLFGVAATDPLCFVGSALLLASVALARVVPAGAARDRDRPDAGAAGGVTRWQGAEKSL